jgi:hypothetical protein
MAEWVDAGDFILFVMLLVCLPKIYTWITLRNEQGALMQGCINGNGENCWNSLIVPMTTTRLETTNVKVIKLWEIGQSAAEPLSNEEGSETMHATSRTDDDIVQTTT